MPNSSLLMPVLMMREPHVVQQEARAAVLTLYASFGDSGMADQTVILKHELGSVSLPGTMVTTACLLAHTC